MLIDLSENDLRILECYLKPPEKGISSPERWEVYKKISAINLAVQARKGERFIKDAP